MSERPRLESFLPLVGDRPRILVLGSMPGVASLARGQYYAHPQNAFWRIAATLFGFDAAAPYDQRAQRLAAAGVAVWDVLAACEREGSLDAAIVRETEIAHPIGEWLRTHDGVERLLLNGEKARAAFVEHIVPTLAPDLRGRVTWAKVPSTSPAHAGQRFEAKLAAWREAIAGVAGLTLSDSSDAPDAASSSTTPGGRGTRARRGASAARSRAPRPR